MIFVFRSGRLYLFLPELYTENTYEKKVKKLILYLTVCIGTLGILILMSSNKIASYPEIDVRIQKMLDYMKIENCKIKRIAEYDRLQIKLPEVSVSKKEIQESIDELLDIYGEKSISEDFVKKELEMNSVQEYYESVRKELTAGKRNQEFISARNKAMDYLIKESKFVLDKESVAEYSVEIVDSYETEAYLYDMELERYVTEELQMTEDEFFEECYREGEELIKNYLIVGAIVKEENLEVTEEDIKELSGVFEKDFDEYSEEEKTYIQYQILENKVYKMFIKE